MTRLYQSQSCQEDIRAAKQASQSGGCTDQTAMMVCPDGDVVYRALDGCQISALSERGWTVAERNAPPSFVEELTPEQAAVGGAAVGAGLALAFGLL